jgi:hypothetical protein
MGTIQPHSSRRKPVEIWNVCVATEQGETNTFFWYKKDAEQYMIDHANDFAADDEWAKDPTAEIDPAAPPRFKSFGRAYKYLNKGEDSWELDTVLVHASNPYNDTDSVS